MRPPCSGSPCGHACGPPPWPHPAYGPAFALSRTTGFGRSVWGLTSGAQGKHRPINRVWALCLSPAQPGLGAPSVGSQVGRKKSIVLQCFHDCHFLDLCPICSCPSLCGPSHYALLEEGCTFSD